MPTHVQESVGYAGTARTVGSVSFVDTGPIFSEDNTNLFWDNTNKILKAKRYQSSNDGTVSAPAIGFTSTTNTGFFLSSSSTIRYASQGSTLVSLGVEAGTTGVHFFAPAATSSGFAFLNSSGTQKWLFRINSNDSNDLSLDGNAGGSAGVMRWQLTGEVGVNTTSFSGSQFFIKNGSTTNIACLIKGIAAQSADMVRVQDSSANTLFSIDSSGNVNFADAKNMIVGTTTGTKIGTATTQKLGFWNAAPVVQDTGWTTSNVTTDRSFDANATSIDELADVLGTLITQLKTYGILGA